MRKGGVCGSPNQSLPPEYYDMDLGKKYIQILGKGGGSKKIVNVSWLESRNSRIALH